ncbi:MAG: hypothetical protein LKF71_06525 [Oscillospiraceae bacterium]|jgi:hypothetical protein|nr:hypothetical protein [Oscillospiraceae bacterium]
MQTDKITHILEQKYSLFCRFFQITEKMCQEPADALAADMDERMKLQAEIEKLDEQLRPLYEQSPEAAKASHNRCNFSELSPENQQVYNAAMKVRGVLCQIQQRDVVVKKRMLKERSRLLKKLEESKRSSASTASRYYRSAHLESPAELRNSGFGKA